MKTTTTSGEGKKKVKESPLKDLYVPHPMETVLETAAHRYLGEEWVDKMYKNGITDMDAMLLEALLKIDRKFWLKLQTNYNESCSGRVFDLPKKQNP